MEFLLEVKNLETSFFTRRGEVQALRNVSFTLRQGEIVGLIGESGCGKSVTALSILRLLPASGRIKSGQILFKGSSLLQLSHQKMEELRGTRISMVFQNSLSSLNPVLTIGAQMEEIIRYHKKVNKVAARQRVVELLHWVGISAPEERVNYYPHQLSGGQRQRVMIAMAISCEPELLLADEPTTALDVTLQVQILNMIRDLNRKFSTSVLLITHDLGIIANTCSKVLVMYGGQIMEQGSVEDIFYQPMHPYTQGLLKTILDLRNGRRGELFCMEGAPPSLLNPPPGCPFAWRCPYSMRICLKSPSIFWGTSTHYASCHLLDESCPLKGSNKW